MTEDVVVYKINCDDYRTEPEFPSVGRDTLEVAKEFCRRPKWPYKLSDHFIGVDDWGHGNVVCATPSFSNWIGQSFREVKRTLH